MKKKNSIISRTELIEFFFFTILKCKKLNQKTENKMTIFVIGKSAVGKTTYTLQRYGNYDLLKVDSIIK